MNLGPLTLLTGENNAGKTNLLAGINHFSGLAARARSGNERDRKLRHDDFFPHRHRLAPSDSAMEFYCLWMHKTGRAEYHIELYENRESEQHTGCRETLRISCGNGGAEKEIHSGREIPADEICLGTKLDTDGFTPEERSLAKEFFGDLAKCALYNFQSSFLRSPETGGKISYDCGSPDDAVQPGYEGGNLQNALKIISETEPAMLERLAAYLRSLENSFCGIGYDSAKNQPLWFFDFWRQSGTPDAFFSDTVSDGILRLSAAALPALTADPPAVIMIEEIENGISQKNIARFLRLMRQSAGPPHSADRGYKTQFIATSHSPSVLREFSDHLEDVYHIMLDRRGYKSVITNLNSVLSSYVSMGTVAGEFEEREEKSVVKITPGELVRLWYSGVISG